MLPLALLSDDDRLAVAFDRMGADAEAASAFSPRRPPSSSPIAIRSLRGLPTMGVICSSGAFAGLGTLLPRFSKSYSRDENVTSRIVDRPQGDEGMPGFRGVARGLRRGEAIELAPFRQHVAAMANDLADLVRRRGAAPGQLAEIIAQYKPWTTVADLRKRWRCSKCGSRDVLPFAIGR